MHHTLSLLAMLGIVVSLHAQYVYTIKADSVKITNCDSAELILENHTQGIPGFLFNTGNGRTQFRHGLVSLGSGSFLVGADTLKLGTNAWLQGGNRFGTTGVIGTLDNNPLNIYTNGSMRVQVTTGGDLLVGTTWDAGALTVQGATVLNGPITQGLGSLFVFGNGIQMVPSGSNPEIYAAGEIIYNSANTGDQHLFKNYIGSNMKGNLVTLEAGAYDYSDSQMVFKVVSQANVCALCIAMGGNVGISNPFPTAQLHVSGTVRFDALTSDSTQNRVLVADANGNLYYRSASSLAANDFPGSSLAVNSVINARQLKLRPARWADYVFDSSSYELPSLSTVAAYIRRERHLPGVPTSAEVEKNGIDVGDNEAVLMKKVEELTLYVIELNKQLESERKETEALRQEMHALKASATRK